MPHLLFKSDDVRRVVEHSINAKAQGKRLVDYQDGKPITVSVGAPSVLLVHDQGVYLMSNGEPRDIVKEPHAFCAYAEGCDPSKDADWWEASRALVGGDDFGETLPWAIEMKAILDEGKSVSILVADNSLALASY